MNYTKLEEYLDLQTLIQKYPQFKEGQIRWLVVNKKQNGLDFAIKRIGRRLYFHIPSFLEWIEKQIS